MFLQEEDMEDKYKDNNESDIHKDHAELCCEEWGWNLESV